jgi:hypothetical protein
LKINDLQIEFGGSGEIRTHERLTPSAVFKTAAFNHSATLPDFFIIPNRTSAEQFGHLTSNYFFGTIPVWCTYKRLTLVKKGRLSKLESIADSLV